MSAVAAPHVDLSGPVERPSTASPGWLLGAAGLIAGLGVAAGLAISFSRHGVRDSPAWRRDGYSDVLELLVTAGAATLAGVGIVWWRRRPGNRIGGLLVCLGADVAAVQSFFWLDTRWMLVAWTLATLALRPLISWLVLAWPAGRLRPSDRRVVAGFAAVEFAIGLAALLSFAPADSRNPIGLLDWPDASAVFFDLNQLVVMPVGAAIVLGIVVRRRRSLPVGARRLALPVVVAASIALAADAIPNPARGFVGDLLDGTAGTTPLGFVVGLFDAGRFVAIAVTLAWAGRLQLRSTPAGTAIRHAEIGELAGQSSVRDLLSAATGDPTARIAYRRASGWLGAGGAPVELGGAGRTVTLLERDREPVAAVELDCTFDDRPSALETAAATVAAALDNERYQALALARLADVQQARLRILDAEDAARRRLERDLHDGAQQHLVGLALEARLAALGRDPVEIDALRAGIAAARRQLTGLADGVLPAMLADRGLTAALGTLATTTPLAVTVDVDLPSTLPPPVAATVWFVVNEAVANAVKHSGARSLMLVASVDRDQLDVRVIDDGCGGAAPEGGSGLRGLQERVGALGGTLVVRSSPGQGTEVHTSLHLDGVR